MPTSPLAIYRRKKGLSQEQLAALSGVSARTIQRIEKGTVEAHLATLKILANCLEIDTELLLQAETSSVETTIIPAKLLPVFHALALVGLFCPILNIVLPGFLWLFKRDELPAYDREGKQVINFQLTMSLAFVPAVFLLVFYFPVGFPLVLLIYFYTMVMCIVNLFKAINRQTTSYKLAFHFLK